MTISPSWQGWRRLVVAWLTWQEYMRWIDVTFVAKVLTCIVLFLVYWKFNRFFVFVSRDFSFHFFVTPFQMITSRAMEAKSDRNFLVDLVCYPRHEISPAFWPPFSFLCSTFCSLYTLVCLWFHPSGQISFCAKSLRVESHERRCNLSLIHIWRCRRLLTCRSRWSPYH